MTKEKVGASLRKHGYKLTPQRRVVIQTLASTQDHLTPTTIYEKVRQEHPNIGFVTIYRTLDILANLGLICELHAGGHCHSYTISALGHHHHLICSGCGKVLELPGCELADVQRNIAKETGFRIDDHLLEFIGLCQACQEAAI